MHKLNQLIRLRWAVRGVLALGVAASVAANILHANPNPISQAISAWPPVALLLTVELCSRIPVTVRWRGALRVIATVAIAGIAAWVSYFHMVGTVSRYGESAPYALPLTVDGLIVVASISLVELAAKIRSVEDVRDQPHNAPTSPGMPALMVEAPEAIAYREAAEQMRRESRLAALNG